MLKIVFYWLFPFVSISLFLYSVVSDRSIPVQQSIPIELDQMIEAQQTLPRYVEAGYSPLGRSPVIDAVLGDPFYLPTYADLVSRELKSFSQSTSILSSSLYDLSTAILLAGGVPIDSNQVLHPFIPYGVPDRFTQTFGEETGAKIYAYWRSFMQIYQEAESALAVLSPKEKEWLRQNYEAFFFGEHPIQNEYDFFTTDSAMPLKFFEMASRVDLVKLAECARKLSRIVDDLYLNFPLFAVIFLQEDFTWEENQRTLIISTRDHVVHTKNVDFFIDLGGNNTFYTNAGGTEGIRAAALHIDVWGNNTYIGDHFVQGCGFLGVGILASFSGNNRYQAKTYSQGCGFFGTGFLMNLGDNNQFEIDFGGQSCALFGSSLLWNKGGLNSYLAHEGMAQAASSTLGVAFLVNNQGGNQFVAGVSGKGGSRYGGIGQGGSIGVRNYPWVGRPSFYGGVSFLYNEGDHNLFHTAWLGQGSAYFLGAGIMVSEGSQDLFYADYDAQGQGLHLSAGLLLKKGGSDHYQGGWGSLGVGGDRSVGMFINTGGYNTYQGTDQSIGTARKPRALGVFIDTQGHNTYLFQKTSNANVQKPESPDEWPNALFLELGGDNRYPQNVDEMQRGADLRWGIEPHSFGIDVDIPREDVVAELFEQFPAAPRVSFPFHPITGWSSNTAYFPLKRASNPKELQDQVQELLIADYERRRQLYESIDLLRFSYPNFEIDLSPLLANPASLPEDLFNYAALWAIGQKKPVHLDEIMEALDQKSIVSDYARKMAIIFVAKLGEQKGVAVLGKLMLTDSSEDNRATAASALAKLATAADIPLLKQGLGSSSEMVRYNLAKGLQDSQLPGALELVTPLFQDPSFYVRRAAALTAISLKDKQGITVLLNTLQIETLDTGDNYGSNLYQALSKYVGVDFGLDKEAWIEWWKQSKDTFEFPATSEVIFLHHRDRSSTLGLFTVQLARSALECACSAPP